MQVLSPKQALKDLKHGAALSLTPEKAAKADTAVTSNMDELLDVDDDDLDGTDSIQSRFGAQKLPGT